WRGGRKKPLGAYRIMEPAVSRGPLWQLYRAQGSGHRAQENEGRGTRGESAKRKSEAKREMGKAGTKGSGSSSDFAGVAAEGEGRSAFGGGGFHTFKERLGSVGEHGVAAVNEEKLAVDAQLRHLDLHQFAAFDLIVDGESGDERDPVAHSDESLDGFEAGQFDVHVERGLVLLKKRDNTAAERRDDV